MWVHKYDEAGDEVWWCDDTLSWSHDRLLTWLQRWESVNLEDNDDDWLAEDESIKNAYIVAGGEGKTSLVTHLAHSLQYKIIEVNNADQEIASVIGRVQEATQSRVMRIGGMLQPETTSRTKRKNKKHQNESSTFTKCPVILIDDLDINIPASQPSLSTPSSIALLTSMDIYTTQVEKVVFHADSHLVIIT